jgi:hypothetical protein
MRKSLLLCFAHDIAILVVCALFRHRLLALACAHVFLIRGQTIVTGHCLITAQLLAYIAIIDQGTAFLKEELQIIVQKNVLPLPDN